MTHQTVLAIDTSAAFCNVCVLSKGVVLGRRMEAMTKGQAERLMPLIEETLEMAGIGYAQLDKIAVGVGPGNFTGVRIAVSAARGLALGLGIPAVGVSGLEAQSYGVEQPHVSFLTAMRNAAQHRVYWQLRGGECAPPEHGAFDDMPRHLPLLGPIDGALMTTCPEIEAIARIGASRAATARPAPLYLRAADAAPPKDPPPRILGTQP